MGGVESRERLKNRSALISAREIAMNMPINGFQLVRLYSNSVHVFCEAFKLARRRALRVINTSHRETFGAQNAIIKNCQWLRAIRRATRLYPNGASCFFASN
jgi:hypothetical protein